jgi:hypothetical protein
MNAIDNEIRINISKSKAFIWTLIAFGLLTVLVWSFLKVWILPSGFNKIFLLTGITLLTITSGFACFSGLTKLIDLRPGLIIDNKGIQINIGPNRGQIINWTEITGLKRYNQIRGSLFLLIFIKNPNDYLSRLSRFRRLLLKINKTSHKTPVSLTSNWLDCSFEELETLIEDKYKKNSAQHAV